MAVAGVTAEAVVDMVVVDMVAGEVIVVITILVGIVLLGAVSIMPVAGSKRGASRPSTSGFVKCGNPKCRYEWNAKNIFKYRCPKCRTRVKWL